MNNLSHPLNSKILKSVREDQNWTCKKLNHNYYYIKKKFFFNIVLGQFISIEDEEKLISEMESLNDQLNGPALFLINPYLIHEVIFEKLAPIPLTINYKETFITPLKTVEELTKRYTKNYRYEINQCAKKLLILNSKQCINEFYSLFEKEVSIQGGEIYPLQYIQSILDDENAFLLSAYENDIYAGGIILIMNKTLAYYYYGAYNRECKGCTGKYLLHYAQSFAIEQGCLYFDFGGVSKQNKKKKQLYDFKKRFGGEFFECCKTYIFINRKIARLLKFFITLGGIIK